MTVKPKSHHGLRRNTFTLSPTTRAVRNALALSLAMAASNPVLAGTCDVSDPSNAVCNGIFTGSNISFAIDDLTIVVGDDLATMIEPLSGSIGIDLYSANGSISLASAADIVSTNAAAISVRAPDGDVDVENRGNLQTSNGDGIEAITYAGNATVVNGGSVLVFGNRGIEVRSGPGDITIDNAQGGLISVSNAYGNATGIDASNYYGDIAITNEGVVDASVVSYGNATGIRANSFTGDLTVAISDTGSVSAITNNNYGGTAIAVRANTSLGGSVVNNDGDINANANAVYGDATSYGVLNRGGYYGDTSTINTGTITAAASTGDGVGWAWGIRDRGRTNADIDNSGDINVEADAGTGYATASGTYVRAMYAHNENSGSITADASVAGIGTARAYGTMTFGYYASMDNSGDISAYSHVGDGVSTAIGAISYYNISFAASNNGTITADAYAGVGTAAAHAIRNGADELATIYNGIDGNLIAHAESGDGAAFAYGAFANTDTSSLTNYGSISADATTHAGNVYGGAIARATGASIQAEDELDASVLNGQYGDISARASVLSEGAAYSFGVIAYGMQSGRLDNQGSISAESYAHSGLAVSVGSVAAGGFGVTLNSGSISADATVANDGFARAVGAYGQGQVATIVNDGSIAANADIATGGATAIGAQIYGAWNAAYNYGDITASASALGGEAFAYGTSSFGIYGSSLLNAATGDITASADIVDGDATAMGAYNVAYVYGASVTNDGSIAATASTANGNATALGVLNIAYLGYDAATTVNNGDISAIASTGTGGTSEAIGVYTSALFSGSSVTNSGSISASAFGPGQASGIVASSVYGDVIIDNTGAISANAPQGSATGVYASSLYGSAELTNSDTGSITASGGSDAAGVVLYGNSVSRLTNHGSVSAIVDADSGSATAYGSIAAAGIGVTLNYGSIEADATVAYAGTAQAIGALSYGSAATIVNEGSITANAAVGIGDALATGAYAYGEFSGIYNYGDIAASASAGDGNAYAFALNSIGINGSSVYNASTGDIAASANVVDGFAVAKGAYNLGVFYGAVATNEGSISATATVSGSVGSSVAGAIGLENASLRYGDAVVVNNGDISASASGGAGYSLAKGVYNFGYLYNAQLTNAGDITASASNAYGYATAFGVQSVSALYGNAGTDNTGTISAIAHVDVGFADATGVDTFAAYDGTVVNNGSILASATADLGLTRAIGITTYVGGAAVTQNFGDITATATGHGEYGYALAAGASTVVAFAVNNTASVDNHGIISATATADGRRGFATATGSGTVAKYAASSNYGSVNVVASAGYTGVAKGFGVTTSGMLSGSTANHGSISVQASTDQGYSAARGVVSDASQLRNANASTVNYGDIHVSAYTAGHADTGYGGFAYAWGVETYGNHYGDIHNVGSITVEADAAFGVARAVAVSLDSKRDGSTLTNDGNIYARASGYTYHAVAVGSDVEARGRLIGATTLNNEGASIIAVATADHGGYAGAVGSGTSVWGIDGKAATMINHGDIIAAASASGGDAFAKAQHTLGVYIADSFNYGRIIAESEAADGLAVAEGNKTWAFYGDATLVNAASVTARADAGATGEAFAYGSVLVGAGNGSTYNGIDGDINAAAFGGGDGLALAVGSITAGDSNSVVNHGDIAASAVTVGYSDSAATGVAVTGDYAAYQWAFQYFRGSVYNVESSVTNDGNISVAAIAELGIAAATGVNAVSNGSVTVSNAGTIAVGADGAAGSTATGLSLNASGSNVLGNGGDITATALAAAGIANATGVDAISQLADLSFANTDRIAAAADGAAGSTATAVSLNAVSINPLSNNGDLIATALSNAGIATAMGLNAVSQYGDVSLVNAGNITAQADGATGGTAVALAIESVGNRTFDNGGSINAAALGGTGSATASGLIVASQDGDVGFTNTGTITVGAEGAAGSTATAVSLNALNINPLSNDGDITATALADAGIADAMGLSVISQLGDLSFANTANLTAAANGAAGSTATALSLYAVSINPLNNHGDITATALSDAGVATALGLDAVSQYGDVSLVNAGSITAQADGAAGGTAAALSMDFVGNGTFSNDGGVNATALGGTGSANASGATVASQSGGVSFTNAATIVAGAEGAAGSSATGLSLNASGSNSLSTDAGISATARAAAGIANATGVNAISQLADLSFANTDRIEAAADGDTGSTAKAVSLSAVSIHPLSNDGDLIATALSDGGVATAIGFNAVSQYGDVSLVNAGSITAQADGAAGGRTAALAMDFAGNGTFSNDGSINATALGGTGSATAWGVHATSQTGNVDFTNTGTIAAAANGSAGSTATALSMAFSGSGTFSNDSNITATAVAGTSLASASGVNAISQNGGIGFANSGSITAVADGGADSTATALSLESAGSNTLINTGSIVAAGTNATSIAVSSSANASVAIDNLGLISGAILTGDLDDTLTNGVGATWNGVGQSDFGAGNNTIDNAGTINLQDATITLLGSSGSASLLASQVAVGDQFSNSGLITVSGDNTIDLGMVGTFGNSGTIDFQDGMADDTLTIAGDFGGDGQLLVDVSGLHGTADVLYVGGSVVNGTHAIDVNLIDVPRTASSAITVVDVAGDSTAASFVLGNVRYNTANFLALDFDTTLVANINPGNAAADTFSLGMEVTGLNDTGALAASVAPGAQSLMASQVGTWRQRMGVIDKISKHSLGLWVRLFQNEGSIEPELAASNFGPGGNFAFDQKNSGTEVGVDFAVADEVSVGLLLAKADGKQDLNGDGVGSSKLDGDTVGAYGTWLSPLGFYVDASYRQMSFDARFNSAAGTIRGSGDADTFNLEAGYAWTLQGGLKVEPQVQYTLTQVDNIDTMTGALAQFRAEGGDASTGRLGVMVRKSFGTGNTVWTPYASINAVHEFDGENAYSINGDFFGATTTEGTSTLFEGGVSVQTGKLSVFGGFNWQDGGALQGFGGGQLGVRYAW
jgi:hypothetical protein